MRSIAIAFLLRLLQPDMDALTEAIERTKPRYLFVGESHYDAGPKRFAADLANRVGACMHIELFVAGIPPGAEQSIRQSRAHEFNPENYLHLVSRVEHAYGIDALSPLPRAQRVALMHDRLAKQACDLNVVLVGRNHAIYAHTEQRLMTTHAAARYRVFRFDENPGDIVEAFPKGSYLVIDTEGHGSKYTIRDLRNTPESSRADFLVTFN